MASSSSSHTYNNDVFLSFHGIDVPETALRRLCKQLNDKGISVFDDGCIERGETISPEVTRAIRESKISIVVLSQNYASSSCCLEELVEIIKCREEFGHIVIPVFYGVDPSDVQKQTGEFGIAFNETCAGKTEEEMGTWSQVLNYMTYILGAHFLNRDNVSYEVIEEIAVEVSKKLNAITSREFEDMVGLEAHKERIKNLLRFDEKEVINTYKLDLPSREDALKILCICAFGQTYPHNGFKELAERVVELTGNLPLHLSIVGSSLRGNKEEEWEEAILRLESTTDHGDMDAVLRFLPEPSSSNKRISELKHQCSTYLAFFVVINLLVEFVSAVADQLSSTKNPCFSRISLVMSVLSVVLTILDLTCKIRTHKARFRCKWPVPWFYYPSRGYNRIFGNFTDTVLLFCVVRGLIVSTVNWTYIEKGQEGPIKISVWLLFFAIGMVGSKFMEKPVISRDYSL